jgi:hypothetical protein
MNGTPAGEERESNRDGATWGYCSAGQKYDTEKYILNIFKYI